jgi:MFS family permease
VERYLRVSHGGFGALLSVAIVAGAITNTMAGALVERINVTRALQRCLLLWGALLVAAALTHGRAMFAVGFIAVVAAGGAVDVVMNVPAAIALSGQPGRLMQFHGLFNAGTVVGAVLTGALLHGGHSFRGAWIVEAVIAFALALWYRTAAVPEPAAGTPAEDEGAAARHFVRVLRREHVVGLALVFGCAALVEGGVETWGVLTLRVRLTATVLAGTGAYVIGQSLATAARVGLGRTAGALGSASGAAIGAALAAAGLVIEALAGSAVLAGFGLALAAVGVSCAWPLLLAHAVHGRDRPGLLVGSITAAGYLGFVAGPPVVGWVAGAFGLRAGLLLIAAVAGVVATSPWHGARQASATTR